MQLVVGEGEPWLQAPAEAQVFNLLLQKLSLLGLHHFLSIFRQVFCELRAARCALRCRYSAAGTRPGRPTGPRLLAAQPPGVLSSPRYS